MPRRRRRRSGYPWWLLLLVLLAAGGVGYRYRGALLPSGATPSSGTTSVPVPMPSAAPGTSGTPVDLPPPRRMACERISAPEVAAALKLPGVAAQRDSAPGSAAADSCQWKSGKISASLAVFDGAGLARQKPPQTASGFFDSVATGLEYDRKDTPRPLVGLGERAVAAGFGRAGGGDLVVLDHGRVLQVTLSAGSEAEARVLAELALRAYAAP